VPEETARIARAGFPKSNRYLRLPDELGSLYTDEALFNLPYAPPIDLPDLPFKLPFLSREEDDA
jgi:hypothetical protein